MAVAVDPVIFETVEAVVANAHATAFRYRQIHIRKQRKLQSSQSIAEHLVGIAAVSADGQELRIPRFEISTVAALEGQMP